jgi:hypothetical protein
VARWRLVADPVLESERTRMNRQRWLSLQP